MKKVILITLFACLATTGCKKEPDQSEISATVSRNQKTVTQFNAADEKIGHFLDQLENTHTSIETRKRIICKDYPIVYHNEYMPTLLQLSTDRSPEQLKQDLKQALDYYKEKYQIAC